MKKVFLIHGFEGSPNGGWRPWLMAELESLDIYACALSMPDSENPNCAEWVDEISRHINRNNTDEIILVGHSLGVPAILRYLESSKLSVSGAVLVAGPCEKNDNKKLDNFFEQPFDFKSIRSKAGKFVVIHGDNDTSVPVSHADTLSRELKAELVIVPNGGHLNGSSGWKQLPQALAAISSI